MAKTVLVLVLVVGLAGCATAPAGSASPFSAWTPTGAAAFEPATWSPVLDDDGHLMERGLRYAVCDKTFHIYSREPYRGSFELISPRQEIQLGQAEPFDCLRTPTARAISSSDTASTPRNPKRSTASSRIRSRVGRSGTRTVSHHGLSSTTW